MNEKLTGDNILHLAARWCPKLDILEYLVRSLNHEMLFERNLKGDTPLSICITLKTKMESNYLKSFRFTMTERGRRLAICLHL